jgi:multimeric flavodoxin WrbA
MKVLLVNGSPHNEGCTYTALQEVAKVLNLEGIETEIYWIGNRPISGCIACSKCISTGLCCIDDTVNPFIEKARNADAFIFGSPVHYAAASGALTSFLDRAFYGKSSLYALKPGAAIVSCRRGGASAAFDQINKYFTISNMPIVSGNYWNQVHGNTPEETLQDLEGLQNMRYLGYNMAWILKCIELGKSSGINPTKEEKIRTNFIR